MKRTPMLTLLGGGALAAGLLIANVVATGGDGEDNEPALAGGETASAPATPEATDEPVADQGDAEPITYVGWVDGGGASVGIVIDGDEATAYVCDGDTVEAWLTGPARNGELLLSGDGGELTGSYDDEQAIGETTAQGRSWTFTIDYVAPPEGLYQIADTVAGGAEVEGGWIVLPDGTQVGVLNVDGEAGPAPALDPATGEVEVAGQVVVAERQG